MSPLTRSAGESGGAQIGLRPFGWPAFQTSPRSIGDRGRGVEGIARGRIGTEATVRPYLALLLLVLCLRLGPCMCASETLAAWEEHNAAVAQSRGLGPPEPGGKRESSARRREATVREGTVRAVKPLAEDASRLLEEASEARGGAGMQPGSREGVVAAGARLVSDTDGWGARQGEGPQRGLLLEKSEEGAEGEGRLGSIAEGSRPPGNEGNHRRLLMEESGEGAEGYGRLASSREESSSRWDSRTQFRLLTEEPREEAEGEGRVGVRGLWGMRTRRRKRRRQRRTRDPSHCWSRSERRLYHTVSGLRREPAGAGAGVP